MYSNGTVSRLIIPMVENLKKDNESVILPNITNKMQYYTIFFITVNALHVSGSFCAHHQELNNCTHSIRYKPSLLAATASVDESNSPALTVTASIYPMLHVQFLSS